MLKASAVQVLLANFLSPDELCQEKLAGAALQAYMLAPCTESQAAALTLLDRMQPSCKLLKTLEVRFYWHGYFWLYSQHMLGRCKPKTM